MLTQEQSEIFGALTNAQGTSLTLKFPKSGEFLSAFVFLPQAVSEAGVAVERVMVFYERADASHEPVIWLTFLEKSGFLANWRVTVDIPFFATGIEQVELAQLGDCENENIIISTSVTARADKSLHVISFRNDNENAQNTEGIGSPQLVYQRNFCVYYEVGDFNASGLPTLLSINLGSGETAASPSIEFATWQEEHFITMFSVPTGSAASEYVKTITGFVPAENSANDDALLPVLFIEYIESADDSNTTIIMFDESGNRPRNITFVADRRPYRTLLSKRVNAFSAHTYARDIDDSGIVRASGSSTFLGHSRIEIPMSERVRYTTWYDIIPSGNTERIVAHYYTYVSKKEDYVYFLSDDVRESITATVTNNPCEHTVKEVTFWEWDKEEMETIREVTTPLLRIVTVPKGAGLCEDFRNNSLDFRWTLYDSTTNSEYDYYVQIINNSIRLRELRKVLIIL